MVGNGRGGGTDDVKSPDPHLIEMVALGKRGFHARVVKR
jgi:hypothetical protein